MGISCCNWAAYLYLNFRSLVSYRATTHSKVCNMVPLGPPRFTVDTTIFEMWLGSLSKHRGLAIPVL